VAYFIGNLFGGFLLLLVVTTLFYKLLKVIKNFDYRMYIAGFLSLMLATIIGGYGFANGGDPVFGQALVSYLTPQLLVLMMYTVLRNKKIPAKQDPYRLKNED